jgi:large subunit ribosomal protein L1
LAAGADEAGLHDILPKTNDGSLDFDVAVTITSAMKEVHSAARILGPRSLMPNPKIATVSDDLPAAIQVEKAGRVESKMDMIANRSIVVRKRSFNLQNLADNCNVAVDVLFEMRPDEFCGKFVESMKITGIMTLGITLPQKIFGKL